MELDFGKKPAPLSDKDPVAENTKEIANIERRLSELEKSQQKLEKELDEKEAITANELESYNEQLKEHKKQIEEMKNDLKEFIRIVMLFVKDLQQTAKTEDMERLQRIVDYWTPETWVTRNDLTKMTKRIIEETENKD